MKKLPILNITDVVAAVLRQSAPNGCQFHENGNRPGPRGDRIRDDGPADLLQEHGAGEAVEGVVRWHENGDMAVGEPRLMIMSGADVAIRSSERADGKLSGDEN